MQNYNNFLVPCYVLKKVWLNIEYQIITLGEIHNEYILHTHLYIYSLFHSSILVYLLISSSYYNYFVNLIVSLLSLYVLVRPYQYTQTHPNIYPWIISISKSSLNLINHHQCHLTFSMLILINYFIQLIMVLLNDLHLYLYLSHFIIY